MILIASEVRLRFCGASAFSPSKVHWNQRTMGSTMTRMLLSTFIGLSMTAAVAGQNSLEDRIAELLPKDARIIEKADVRIGGGKARVLVLWMEAPKRVTASWDTAADFVYGDHWFGPTSLSLTDPLKGKLINTVAVRPYIEWPDDKRGFEIPFFTSDAAYYVPLPNKDHRGTPVLLHLQDLTGEGVAGQFTLFDSEGSGIYASSAWGYSPKSDTAVQYPVEVIEGKFKPVIQNWVTQVFATTPTRAGYWKFTWEAGHGSEAWIDEEVHFDPGRQLFIEMKTIRPYPGLAQAHCDLKMTSLPDFLHRVEKVAPDFNAEAIQGVQSLIDRTPIFSIEATGIVATFRGVQKSLQFEWQLSDAGRIGIEFMTESDFTAALLTELKGWCGAN